MLFAGQQQLIFNDETNKLVKRFVDALKLLYYYGEIPMFLLYKQNHLSKMKIHNRQ